MRRSVTLLCPTRGRPKQFERFVRSVVNSASKPERVEILAYVDDDDDEKYAYLMTVKSLAADTQMSRLLNFDLLVDEPIRTPLINNVLAERAQGDDLMIANDDQIFRGGGWDQRIDEEADRFPDGIYCMWFDDGRYGETVCTFPIISRTWVKTLGYMESPLFEHFNCDLWTWQIAVSLGRAQYIGDILVEHVHPDTGKVHADKTTARQLKGNRTGRDRALYAIFERYRLLDASILQGIIDSHEVATKDKIF